MNSPIRFNLLTTVVSPMQSSMFRRLAVCLALIGLTPALHAQSVCTQVKIKISQELVLTKKIFTATLEMQNETGSLLENVELDFSFKDLTGVDVAGDFLLHQPTLSGGFTGPALPSFVSPTAYTMGALFPGTSGTVAWPIEPLESATWDGLEHQYAIGGVLRYTKNGTTTATPLFPQTITVAPNAKLVLDYYLKETVWADDPFTMEVIEPSEPFFLGLRLQNTGLGIAKDVKINTEQPKITNNFSQLLIAFKIIAAAIGCDPAKPILDLEIGDIPPGESRVVTWALTSSLKGQFADIKTSFTHKSSLGESLLDIDASGSHLAVHMVKLGSLNGDPVVDDLLPDFLVDEGAGAAFIDPLTGYAVHDLPSRVDSSDGSTYPVQALLNVPMDAPPSSLDLVTNASVQINQVGWTYLRLPDLGGAGFVLSQVARTGPDGRRVSFSIAGPDAASSAWTTRRNVDIAGTVDQGPDAIQYLVHLFSHVSVPGTYSFDFVYTEVPNIPLSADKSVLSVTTGGQQNLTLNAGPERAGQFYYMLGTLSGTTPGTPFVSLTVPINIDNYTNVLLFNPGLSSILNFFGNLDANGRASAKVIVPPNTKVSFVGLTANHAYILFGNQWDFVSNPVELHLVL